MLCISRDCTVCLKHAGTVTSPQPCPDLQPDPLDNQQTNKQASLPLSGRRRGPFTAAARPASKSTSRIPSQIARCDLESGSLSGCGGGEAFARSAFCLSRHPDVSANLPGPTDQDPQQATNPASLLLLAVSTETRLLVLWQAGRICRSEILLLHCRIESFLLELALFVGVPARRTR
jgi:hypothetical protein